MMAGQQHSASDGPDSIRHHHVPGIMTASKLAETRGRIYEVEVRIRIEVPSGSLIDEALPMPNGELRRIADITEDEEGNEVVVPGYPIPACMGCNAAEWAWRFMEDLIDMEPAISGKFEIIGVEEQQ